MYKDPSLVAYNSLVRSLNADYGYYAGHANKAGSKKKAVQASPRMDEIKAEPESAKRSEKLALAFT